MNATRKTALLIGYILLTGTIFLYFLFPSVAVKDHFTHRLNGELRDINIEIGDLRPVFPVSVSLDELTAEKNGTLLLSMDRLKLSPRWYSLLLSEKTTRFIADTCQGEVKGRASVSSTVQKGKTVNDIAASGTFSNIQLNEIPIIQTQFNDRLSGILSGDIQLQSITSTSAEGSGTFFISNCNFALPVTLLNLEEIRIDHGEAEFEIHGNLIEILGAEVEGPELSGVATGAISIKFPISRSTMDLDVSITPLQSSTLSGIKALRLELSGTFENPKINFGSDF